MLTVYNVVLYDGHISHSGKEIQMTATEPGYALVRQTSATERETFPGWYSDLAAAWRSADWSSAHYPHAYTYVVDIQTGEPVRRPGVERPRFESDADIEDYYRVQDDDGTTFSRAF